MEWRDNTTEHIFKLNLLVCCVREKNGLSDLFRCIFHTQNITLRLCEHKKSCILHGA